MAVPLRREVGKRSAIKEKKNIYNQKKNPAGIKLEVDGRGVRCCPLRKKELFLNFFFTFLSILLTTKPRQGGTKGRIGLAT